ISDSTSSEQFYPGRGSVKCGRSAFPTTRNEGWVAIDRNKRNLMPLEHFTDELAHAPIADDKHLRPVALLRKQLLKGGIIAHLHTWLMIRDSHQNGNRQHRYRCREHGDRTCLRRDHLSSNGCPDQHERELASRSEPHGDIGRDTLGESSCPTKKKDYHRL